MATQSMRIDEDIRRVRQVVRANAAENKLLRYQLDVIGRSAVDVAAAAGGWLFDRAMAGWEVNVLLGDLDDVRPLRVLGVRTLDLHSSLSMLVGGPEQAAGLAVAGDLLATDDNVYRAVLSTLRTGLTEVALWGDRWPGQLDGRADSVQFRLSAAARTFKRHALAAAQRVDGPVGATEALFRSGYCPVDSDLIPVG